MILERTVELVKQIYRYERIWLPKVNRVVIGLGYTGVELLAYSYNPFLGLAYTLPSIIKNTNCGKLNFAGILTEKKIDELLEWAYGVPSLKKIIGIATLNAVSQHILKIKNPYTKIKIDIVDYLKINNDTKVTFIGLIAPMIKKISDITKSLIIIENNLKVSTPFKDIIIKNNIDQLKDEELSTDILFCTGTALINNTLEDILQKFKRKAQRIVVIGPSASMIPDIMFDYGVNIVGGMKIINTDATIRVLQEGGGTKLFKQFGKKYNLIKE